MQEDISRLRRKLETTKKPDMVPNCDEILMEEIKDYKVSSCLYQLPSLILLQSCFQYLTSPVCTLAS